MDAYQMYINGDWVSGSDPLEVLNPATEEVVATVPSASEGEIQRALEGSKEAQKGWSRLTGVERGNVLRKWAELIDQHRDEFAQLLSKEVGKPLAEAYGEVDFGNTWFRYYAEFDRRIDGDILAPDHPNEQLWIIPCPVGVVVGIIAWNFPFALAIRKIAPALIAGNSIILKPHEDTPLSELALVKLAAEAGVPPGVVNVLTGPGETVGEALVKSPIPGLISFTGSVPTGKRIAQVAAENVTAISLEMGGKAPFIVMDDCDVETAVDTAIISRIINCGQICIANERTYLHKSIADQFLERFVEKMKAINVGNPLKEGTQIGPKVNREELEKVDRFVEEAKSQGARALTGGRVLKGGDYDRGYWYEPTVLVDVKQDMDIMHKEIFGPVVPVMTFDSFEQGIELANDSNYGLAGFLFTNDMNRIMVAIRDLEIGELYINRGIGESIHGYHIGWKQSGIGGDDGKYGLEHYLRRKTVYLKYNPEMG